MKYAEGRGAPIAILMGEDEMAAGEVTLKDLVLGKEMAKAIESNEEWRSSRPAQESIARAELIPRVKAMLAG